MTRLIGYVRVSTEEQAQSGHSLGQQPLRLAQYAQLHGHELVEVVTDEGVSGSVPLSRRPAGAKVLRALREGRAQGVVIIRLDRLFRDALDGLTFFRQHQDITVHSVSEHIDTSSPQGKLQLGMQLLLAEYERDLAVQRAQDNTRGLRESGQVYGHVPYGCVAVEGRLFREPESWAVRQQIVTWKADGLSLSTISGLLRDNRIDPPGVGRRWAKSTLSHLIRTHPDLVHLPMAHDHGGAGGGAPEAGASPTATTH